MIIAVAERLRKPPLYRRSAEPTISGDCEARRPVRRAPPAVHLDLIMLVSLTAAAPRLVPSPPHKVGVPLAVGAWVNANAFGVLAFRPDMKDYPVYRASVATPFVAASRGFTGLAAVAWKRWLEER